MTDTPLTSRVRAWLNDLPIGDPVSRHMASLLQMLLIGFMVIIIIASIVNVFISPATPAQQIVLVRTVIFLFIIGIPLFLLRRGSFRSSVHFIIAIFLVLETFAVAVADLRSIAETLSFFTLAIFLAGTLIGRRALIFTFLFVAAAVFLGAIREQDQALRLDSFVIALNFILLNGLIAVFLDQFGITLRAVLSAALERESELKYEISIREQAEAALEQFATRLEILHEIDCSLLDPHTKSLGARWPASVNSFPVCAPASHYSILIKGKPNYSQPILIIWLTFQILLFHWRNTD